VVSIRSKFWLVRTAIVPRAVPYPGKYLRLSPHRFFRRRTAFASLTVRASSPESQKKLHDSPEVRYAKSSLQTR
jgi:hypothetical protein